MKKFLIAIIGLLLLIPQTVKAEVIPHKVYAAATKAIDSRQLNKNSILTFRAIDNYKISDKIIIEKNSDIAVRAKEYINPKRGKRDGYLKVQLISYTIPSKDKYIEISEIYEGSLRPSNKKDFKEIAEHTGVSVAGHFLKIPGFSQAVAVSKGLINPNQDESRLKSAGKNLYESTPLTYIEKGKDFNIDEDTIVVISFKEYNVND